MAPPPESATWHAVTGLGTDGGQALVDGDALARGVHLLWTIRPELGFPAGGFTVLRRNQRDPEAVCLSTQAGLLPPPGGVASWSWQRYELSIDPGVASLDPGPCSPTGALHLPGERSLTVRAPDPMVKVRATGVGDPPVVEALAGDITVALQQAGPDGGDGWVVELWAPVITQCRITGVDLRICTVCFAQANLPGGWRALGDPPILLPVVAPGTANTPEHLHDAQAARAEAYARLSATLADSDRGRLADDFAAGIAPLAEDLVRSGGDAALPAAPTEAAEARTPPLLAMATSQALALTAIDPDVSRMLGLYWHDPVDKGIYDYRVVAHHGEVRYPSRVVTFADEDLSPIAAATLTRDGVTIVGDAGLAVVAASSDSSRRALRVEAPRIGTAAAIALDPPAPAVTVRLDPSTVVGLLAWQGTRRLPSLSTPLSTATFEDPGGIDAITWSAGPVELLEVEIYAQAGFVGDLVSYAWRLGPERPAAVQDLVITMAGADVEPTRLNPDGTVDEAVGVAGIDWGETSPVHDASRPVRALVGRLPGSDAPARKPDIRNADRPAPAFATTATQPPTPGVPSRWRERGLKPGHLAWFVRGIDAFGRLGDWSAPAGVTVPARTTWPPPAFVQAAYLDPADPLLSDDQRALAERDGAGLLVEWTWPAARRIAAPDVESDGEFRIYARTGDPNVLAGSVTSVTDLGDRSRLGLNVAVPGAADQLAGERLRVGGTSFEVLADNPGRHGSVTVAHRSAPTARPTSGAFTIFLSEASPLRTDLTSPGAFDARIASVPVGSLPRVTATIVAVDAPTGKVTLDAALPAGATELVPGLLVSGAIGFRVLTQTTGMGVVTVARAAQADGSLLLPSAGRRATLWPGARYEAWIPGAGAPPQWNESLALSLVGVSTAATGGEGPASPIARVRVPHRDAPDAVTVTLPPDESGDIPADLAEPANWYGRARYELTFAPVPDATGYRVARASVPALFARDRIARQTARDPYAGGPFDDLGASEAWLAEHYPTVSIADLTADLETNPDAATVLDAWRGWSAWYYPARTNREVMALADLACNEDAFQPAHAGTIDARPFTDSLDGRGLGRFVYRVRSVDASQNASPWSSAFPIVEVRDVTAPATPSITSTLAAENAVVLRWRANREPDLAGYRIWRSRDPAELGDVRRRTPHAQLAPSAGAVTEEWSDEGLAERLDWHYRLAAFDAAGNVSEAGPIVRARPVDTTPPSPPAWTHAEWGLASVELAWEGDEDGLTCLLERQADRSAVWAPISDWLAPAGPGPRRFSYTDALADRTTTWRYRVRARDAAGNVATALREIVVDRPTAG